MKFIKHPTKIFIENIVKKQSKNELNAFVCSNYTITEDSDEIINDINKYYIDLLGEEPITDETLLNYEFSMRKINGVIKKSFPNINDKISYSEAYQVIMDIWRNQLLIVMVLQLGFLKRASNILEKLLLKF